ncbi:MAG: right-handed parallel beta-helix repeat-containing protein, partial [Sedimentisphaerales bacterium]|nr:right-handed parallel beta-helix repeat-containing protein [Sedimentisphaerales bacterium]
KVLNVQAKHTQNLVLSANNIGSRPSMHKVVVDGYDDGILFENCTNAIIDGNILSDLRYGSADQGGAVTLLNARNVRVSDCQIIHPHFRGIHLINGVACVFSDNTIEGAGEDFQTAIEVSGESKSNLVQQNLIIADAAKSITMQENTGTRVGNTIVAGK